MGTVLQLVGLVCLRGVPPQIHQSVVGQAAVVVTALHAWRARTNEGLKNEAVDPLDTPLAVTAMPPGEKDRTPVLITTADQPAPGVAHGRGVTKPAGPEDSLPAAPHRTVVSDSIARQAGDIPILHGRRHLTRAFLLVQCEPSARQTVIVKVPAFGSLIRAPYPSPSGSTLTPASALHFVVPAHSHP